MARTRNLHKVEYRRTIPTYQWLLYLGPSRYLRSKETIYPFLLHQFVCRSGPPSPCGRNTHPKFVTVRGIAPRLHLLPVKRRMTSLLRKSSPSTFRCREGLKTPCSQVSPIRIQPGQLRCIRWSHLPRHWNSLLKFSAQPLGRVARLLMRSVRTSTPDRRGRCS